MQIHFHKLRHCKNIDVKEGVAFMIFFRHGLRCVKHYKIYEEQMSSTAVLLGIILAGD
jgi:penicillin-binding protein-related factor A (putative recombinase)